MAYGGNGTHDTLVGAGSDEHIGNEVRVAIAKLHSRGYVHGDIRDVNVVVKRSNLLHVVFVDWDWAGKNGEVEYPVSINPNIPRHSTAVGLAPIEKIHDIFMFERLFPSLASKEKEI